MTPDEKTRIQSYLSKIRLTGTLTREEKLDMGDILRREMEAEPWKEGSTILKGLEN